ncbi:hypothetical protein FSOLCH5_007795 [Fusarium solani]
MVNIAVAGGTGKVGKTILEVLKSQTRHKAFLLTRKNAPSNDDSVTSVTVDYSDATSLTEALERHEIHTVICCLPYEGNALEIGQGNLIKASEASVHTKRFVPSAFGINYPREAVKELPVLKHYFQAIETLRQSSLEWTIFQNGCFLDYWGHPHIKSYLRPSPFGIDIAGKVAAIPGDGDARFTVTYSFDVAKYVVAALDLDEWPETTRIAGDIITWKEFVNLAESTTGK